MMATTRRLASLYGGTITCCAQCSDFGHQHELVKPRELDNSAPPSPNTRLVIAEGPSAIPV